MLGSACLLQIHRLPSDCHQSLSSVVCVFSMFEEWLLAGLEIVNQSMSVECVFGLRHSLWPHLLSVVLSMICCKWEFVLLKRSIVFLSLFRTHYFTNAHTPHTHTHTLTMDIYSPFHVFCFPFLLLCLPLPLFNPWCRPWPVRCPFPETCVITGMET